MEKFILRNKAGRPVFIQQDGNLTKPVVRLTPANNIKGNMVAHAFDNMAAIDPNEEADK